MGRRLLHQQRLVLRRAEVARIKGVLAEVWAKAASKCAVCKRTVQPIAASLEASGRVVFVPPTQIDVAHGRLLCGVHFASGKTVVRRAGPMLTDDQLNNRAWADLMKSRA